MYILVSFLDCYLEQLVQAIHITKVCNLEGLTVMYWYCVQSLLLLLICEDRVDRILGKHIK